MSPLLKSNIPLFQLLIKPFPILPDDSIPHKLENSQPLSPTLPAGGFADPTLLVIEIFHSQPVAPAAERIQVAGNRLLEINSAGVVSLLYAAADDTVFLDAGIGAESEIEDGGAALPAVSVTGSFCDHLVAPGLREVGRQLLAKAARVTTD